MRKLNESSSDQTRRIQELNDRLRKTFAGGAICITHRLADILDTNAVIAEVQSFDHFNEANDPWREHDFGALQCQGEMICWKIDYYGPGMRGASPNAADPEVTERVLTIMLGVEF